MKLEQALVELQGRGNKVLCVIMTDGNSQLGALWSSAVDVSERDYILESLKQSHIAKSEVLGPSAQA